MAQVVLDPNGLSLVRRQLEARLTNAAVSGSGAMKEIVRVDTGRMQKSIRTTPLVRPTPVESLIVILVGGIELYGVYREQDIKRLVDYSALVEIKYADIRKNLSFIIEAMVRGVAS